MRYAHRFFLEERGTKLFWVPRSPPPLPAELGSLPFWQSPPHLKSLGSPPSKLVATSLTRMARWIAPDYGFDPLGLGKDPAFLKWYREAELIHGRWAMAAVLGIFIGQAWSGIPWFEAGGDPAAIAPFSFGSLLGTQLILMGWVESKRWVDFFNPESQSVEWATPWSQTAENFANATGEQGYPGGKFFDPLGLAGSIQNGVHVPDYDKLERLKLAEIKHARGKTPLGALGL
ncbi:Chlorophyll a-b binding protein CP24 10A [Hibiscus syriacus]|uniref:Chlorophyll a-b binding protein, chloroplastic n=1 Tax=Hibiscus syriacus TaxID=106335 RepID=A0A6A2YBP8_HIBSY|nr:Chlorophyll a-b binding protein CP24 10A [Hibiscus syriacus]